MAKYGMKIVFETNTQYNKVEFITTDHPNPEAAEKDLKKWIDQPKYKELRKQCGNPEIRALVFPDAKQ